MKGLWVATFTAFLGAMVLAGPSPATAGDFGHSGPYVGVGFGGGFDFLQDPLKELVPGLDIKPSWSFNARLGYRVTSWFAVEAMYEGVYDLEYESDDLPIDLDAEFSFHSLVGNFKFVAPIWRIQPYLLLGFGAQYASWDGLKNNLGFDTDRWDFVFRPALGVDGYITEHWVVFAELAPSVRVARWDEVPSELTDNVTMTVGGGIQYRF